MRADEPVRLRRSIDGERDARAIPRTLGSLSRAIAVPKAYDFGLRQAREVG